jgi:DNA-binding HxlR family transcriptional regulator
MVRLLGDGLRSVTPVRWRRDTLRIQNRTSNSEVRPPYTLPADHTPSSPPSTLALLELLGRRWALRILWELRREPASFQALQVRCDSMSTSVLSQRLGELREARIVEKDKAGAYRLTEPGTELLARLDGMDEWTRTWGALLGGAAAARPRSSS